MYKSFISLFFSLLLALGAHAEVRYVFYFIGDGMGMGPSMAANMYTRTVLNQPEGLTMMQFPVVSMTMTYSASSPVTDSAAAGTALASGKKTSNSTLGIAADGSNAISIARQLKDAGWGVGITTSVSPDDATPGAFYAHVPKRSQYYDVAASAAASGYDFIAGAGLRCEFDKKDNPTGIISKFESAGYQVLRGPAEIATASSDKILLLNTPGVSHPNNISYTIDSVASALSLPLITETAIRHLQKVSPDRFFLMVEGGNIDHALHANDGGGAIKEIVNFNQAIQLAYNFYREHPEETIILITADHDTGGMALGNSFRKYAADLQYIDHQRISKDKFSDYCKAMAKDGSPSWEAMKQFLNENLGLYGAITVSDEQDARLRQMFADTFLRHSAADEKSLYADYNAFSTAVFRVLNDIVGIGFTTTSHSGNPVPVCAIGPGTEIFSNLNDNSDLPVKIMEIVGQK